MRLTDSDYRIYNLPYETTGAISVNLIYQRPNLVAYTNNGQVFNYNPISERFDLVLNLNNNSSNVDVYTILLIVRVIIGSLPIWGGTCTVRGNCS
jgi:hypothetical protein